MAFFHFFGPAEASNEEPLNYLKYIQQFLQKRNSNKSKFFTKISSDEVEESDAQIHDQ